VDAVTSLAAAERAALLDLMARVGPDAGTLVAPWNTHDLAAHLVVRERRPLAVPGLVLPPLHRVTAALERRMRTVPYEELLDRLRSGPPVWSPAGALPGPLDDLAELHEMFVHHEDVRRVVDPEPRRLSDDLSGALWTRVRVMGPGLALRARGLGLTAETPDGRSAALRRGRRQIVLRGTPGELLLWLFGRRAAAQVVLAGAPEAVAAAGTARLGW
jgi:uncharacterized protein (TIGR03085 family)